jgi:hypothetical protein
MSNFIVLFQQNGFLAPHFIGKVNLHWVRSIHNSAIFLFKIQSDYLSAISTTPVLSFDVLSSAELISGANSKMSYSKRFKLSFVEFRMTDRIRGTAICQMLKKRT